MSGRRSKRTYEFMTIGDCLGNFVPNGTFLSVDPRAEISLGSLVAVVLKRGGPFSGFARALGSEDLLGVTKIFLGSQIMSSGETVYLVGQLNPPTVSPIPTSGLEAMHLVTGGQLPSHAHAKMSDQDNAAMELLGLFFCGGGSYAPINPEWQPPGEGE